MNFFDSDVVRSEVAHIAELQEDLYQSAFKFYSMGKEEKLKHVELISTLLEKQKILYTILTLSDDPSAKQMKENIMASAKMMGLPDDIDMTIVFSNMEKLINQMKKQVQ